MSGESLTSAPVHWSRWCGGWVVTRHTDTMAALRMPALRADDPLARLDRLREKGGPELENFRKFVSTISFYIDEPRHDGIRRFIAQIFQGIDLADLRTQLQARAVALLVARRNTGRIDLAGDFACDLALFAIHLILEIPFEDCLRLGALARELGGFFDFVPRTPRQLLQADRRLGELLTYFAELVADRRRAPRADRISLMIDLAARNLNISDLELAGFSAFFFVAGEETTATGIAASSVLLLQRRDVREPLVAEPSRIPDAVRELLASARHSNTSPGLPRRISA